MKKTIIALLALGSMAMGAEYTGDFAWSAGATPTLTFADEVNCPLTFVLSTTESYKSTTYLPGTFTPDSNVGNGDDWTLSFTVTNSGAETVTLSGITLGVFTYNSGGVSQGADTVRPIILTLTGDVTGVTNYTTNGATSGSLAPAELVLDSEVSIEAGSTISFALNVQENDTLGTFVGLKDATFTTAAPVVPEPATATLSLLALAGLAARRRR